MMDFKNSAMKLFSNEEPIDIYTGPYVVRPGELDILVRTLIPMKTQFPTRIS